ncbi:sushi, nidogen and EGF-like domain-containing protein 1, partial [Mizuhopecten yessoensis]
EDRCVSFYYQVNRRQFYLDVYVLPEGSNTYERVWELPGPVQKDTWLFAEVDVSEKEIAIAGWIGRRRSRVSVDNIKVSLGTCASLSMCNSNTCANGGTCTGTSQSFTCTCAAGYQGTTCTDIDPCTPNPCENGGTCVPESDGSSSCICAAGFSGSLCDTEDPEIMACSFEDGEQTCSLTQVNYDYFNWIINTNSTSIPSSAPISAYDGDKYMYIDTAGKDVGTYGMLVAHDLPDEVKCLTFNYHMKGAHHYLQIYTADNYTFELQWQKSGDQGNDWNSATFRIRSRFIEVYFVGVVGSYAADLIAIDNVRILRGDCS